MSTPSSTVLEAATDFKPLSASCSSYGASRHAAEIEGATGRFAAAQKLFNEQAVSSSQLPSPPSLTRQRTNTITSLYAKLDLSVSGSSSTLPSSTGVATTHGSSSFTDTLMRSRPLQTLKSTTAISPASSQAPATPVDAGCILLGPRRTLNPLDVTKSINARTCSGSPAWFCRHDKLVVFEGFKVNAHGVNKMVTRNSRGLDMARRNCPKTPIVVDIPCSHCQDLLRRKTWVFEERMREGGVCRECQERCVVEWARMDEKVLAEGVSSETSNLNSDAVPKAVPAAHEMDTVAQQPAMLPRPPPPDTKPLEHQAKRDSMLQDDDDVVA